jgi:hypothetical protein
MRNKSLTPDPSPKGEGSRMKNGVGLPSGWKFLTSHSSLLTNKKNGAVFSGGGRKLLQGTEKGINFASQFRKRAQQNNSG